MRYAVWTIVASLVVMLAPLGTTAQDEGEEHPGLERMRSLAGSWKIVPEKEGDKAEEGYVDYRVTAMGSAIIETLFPDTQHEMVTVYHLDGDKLMLTHYCAMGNQPEMKQVETDRANVLKFVFSGGTGVDKGTMRMAGLTLSFLDDGRIKHEWVVGDGTDKAGGKKVFVLERLPETKAGPVK